ncbi:MAG: glycosyltransferase family 4 protein [Planctomycetota bacterium]|jgi:glycosyltransferase involved in cell wall biosynthesis
MKVAVLARGINRPGGVGRLLSGYLSSLPAAAPDWDFVALTDEDLPPRFKAANLTEVLLPKSNPAVFDHILVPRAVREVGADVFLAMKNTVPARLKCPTVCVFLDLAYFALPKSYPFFDNLYMRAMFRHSARRASRIAAISRWTKEDVRNFLGGTAYEKTRVIYPGLEKKFRRLSEDEMDKARGRMPDLPERFALYAGNISPRKNLVRLLAAFETLDDDIALVITGHRRWKSNEFEAALGRARRKRNILVSGAVVMDDLCALYNLALFTVYPSLYEGFGFPVLESFACGTPVAASNAASIPEVAGDAGLLFEPRDIAAISDAIRRLAGDPGLGDQLVQRGTERLGRFTWQRASTEMVKVLEEVL